MNRINEELLQDLNRLFVADGQKKEDLLTDMIISTNKELTKEKENGMIFISLDLETGEGAFRVKSVLKIHRLIEGYSDIIALLCDNAFKHIDDLTSFDLDQLVENTPLEAAMKDLLEDETERKAFLKEMKEKYYGLVREQLTEGFKNGMERKLDHVVKKSYN